LINLHGISGDPPRKNDHRIPETQNKLKKKKTEREKRNVKTGVPDTALRYNH
jgi:hypothetical protein